MFNYNICFLVGFLVLRQRDTSSVELSSEIGQLPNYVSSRKS